jgi:hypothetical protein
MPMRADKPKVLVSLEDADGFRCVDIFERSDGSFGFKEFRRDPEDAGRWTLVADYAQQRCATKEDALRAATAQIVWLGEQIKARG